MIRSHSFLLACLALSVACASSKSQESENPDAGTYDGFYSETDAGGAADGGSTATEDGDTANTPSARPKARASTSTRAGARKTGKRLTLSTAKPPVSGGDKPRPAPTNLKAEFEVAGMFPTSAAVGSVVEIYGSEFPEDPAQANVFIGGKKAEVLEITEGVIVAKVTGEGTGKVEVGKGTKRMNRRNRAKSQKDFVATAADGSFGQPRTVVGHGLLGMVYPVDAGASEVPNFNELGGPVALIGVDDLDIPAGEAANGVAGLTQSFGIHFQGSLNITEGGEYEICLAAGDGALLFLDQTPIVDVDGSGATREECEVLFVEPGEYGLDLLYYQGADTEAGLTLTWAKDGGAKESIPAQAFFPPEGLRDAAIATDQN